MSSENLHAPRERLSQETLNLHFAIVSLMEELDAIDWYRQRADDAEDETLKQLLLHNMREEMEHASMLLEWIRRRDSDFERFLKNLGELALFHHEGGDSCALHECETQTFTP